MRRLGAHDTAMGVTDPVSATRQETNTNPTVQIDAFHFSDTHRAVIFAPVTLKFDSKHFSMY